MKRRTLVRGGVAAGAAAIAGCIGAGGRPGGRGDGTGGDGPAGKATDGAAGGDGDGPALGEPSFEVVESGCGTEVSTATVRRDDGAGEVVVAGTIPGRNACYTAALDEAVYGAETDSLWVSVVTEERPDAEVCGQCIVEVDYRVRLPFEGGLPGRVGVTHDGALVCPDGEREG